MGYSKPRHLTISNQSSLHSCRLLNALKPLNPLKMEKASLSSSLGTGDGFHNAMLDHPSCPIPTSLASTRPRPWIERDKVTTEADTTKLFEEFSTKLAAHFHSQCPFHKRSNNQEVLRFALCLPMKWKLKKTLVLV